MGHYRQWASTLNLTEMLAATTASGWLAAAALAAVLVGAPVFIPGLKAIFALDPWPAALVFAFAPLTDLLTIRAYKAGVDRALVLGLSMASCVFVQLFCGLLVAHSSALGASVYSSFFVFTSGYYGYVYRATPKQPYITVATAVVLLFTVLDSPLGEHLAVLAVVIPAAICGSIILGTYAVRADERRAEALRLREALSARMLEDESMRAERLVGAVEQMAMWNHDMRNALTVALGNTSVLGRLKLAALSEQASAELEAGIAGVRGSLEILSQGLDQMREVARGMQAQAPAVETVALLNVLGDLKGALQTRFPNVELLLPRGTDGTSVVVCGGQLSLHRLLENLLVNACEGDGERGAQRVELSVRNKDELVELRVCDDGPGFSAMQLAKAITGFETTKPHGTGLGLYTAERLVAATAGSLERGNRPEGGAVVTVRLPSGRGA